MYNPIPWVHWFILSLFRPFYYRFPPPCSSHSIRQYQHRCFPNVLKTDVLPCGNKSVCSRNQKPTDVRIYWSYFKPSWEDALSELRNGRGWIGQQKPGWCLPSKLAKIKASSLRIRSSETPKKTRPLTLLSHII